MRLRGDILMTKFTYVKFIVLQEINLLKRCAQLQLMFFQRNLPEFIL